MLRTASCGFGAMAFAGMCGQASAAYQSPLAPKLSHFAPRAKRVIFFFMQGGPSHVDTFDYKPKLKADHDKPAPRGNRKMFGGPFEFNRCGESGLPISEVFPHLSRHADDLCLINSMHTDNPAHPQATLLMHTGNFTFVRPSVGAWTLYGLGMENENVPGFITINPLNRLGGAQNYGAGFLPAAYQGTTINTAGGSVPNIKNPKMSAPIQRKQLDLVQSMNKDLLRRQKTNNAVEGVIESFELAFKMQTAVPGIVDVDREPQAIRDLYAADDDSSEGRFGRQCLIARRFAEQGVRYIEIGHNGWDQHNSLKARLSKNANDIDRGIAALISDLKQRGMFEETLIVWGGEFGRTPDGQGKDGRSHNNRGFSVWMAGGGVKGGMRYGSTDEYGYEAVENKVHIHDLHATMLYLMGLDHEKLTYRYSGRDFRLTDVYGRVLKDIIA
ncbi:MAG: DUF1501 domain-containing protein [Planctomycetota bacterium]|jgi:hypothetical protein